MTKPLLKPLPHAEVISHMALHGFESVQRLTHGHDGVNPDMWVSSSISANPITHFSLSWRIKPATITVEIPKPSGVYICPTLEMILKFDSLAEQKAALEAFKKAMES